MTISHAMDGLNCSSSSGRQGWTQTIADRNQEAMRYAGIVIPAGLGEDHMKITEKDLVLNKIPMGRDNAVSRYALRTSTGLSDRKVRDIIAELRVDGHFVLNTDKGYYVANTDDPKDMKEMERFVKRESHRAISTFKGVKYMRIYLRLKGVNL